MIPPQAGREARRLMHTYYLGTLAAAVWLVMVATGVLMMLHVRPAVPGIYHDLKDLQFTVEHGALVRNLHRWGASALVIVVALHLLRSFFQRSYLAPRRGAWYAGLALFVLTMGSAHSGYLLPWDQRAYWGIVVAETMVAQLPVVGGDLRVLLLGGPTIGPDTVLRLYVVHCVLIPLATTLLIAVHLARVRRAGDAGSSGVDNATRVPALTRAPLREVFVLQTVIVALMALALSGDPPLEAPANPTVTPDPIKPPWYFVGLQELLHYFPPIVSGAIAPALVIGLLAIAPFAVRTAAPPPSRWTRRAQVIGVVAALTATAMLAYYAAWALLASVLFVEALALWSYSRRGHASGMRRWLAERELVEWLMIGLLALAAAATLTGVLFRGPGGAITSPLQMWRSP